jgi:hypothetical protein
VSGSLLDGLGRWVDIALQPFFKATPHTLQSSSQLKDIIMDLLQLPQTARFFTADAVSMSTNIDTAHALRVIKTCLSRNPLNSTIHTRNALMEGLELILKHNILQFGDTYWLQSNGTAMGVSSS